MTKKQKIASLSNAMTRSARGAVVKGQLDPSGEEYYHFTNSAPEELTDLYLEHYEVRDLDYEIFSVACNMVAEIYNDEAQEDDGIELIEEQIYDRSSDIASVFTSERLSYLNMWNEEDIGDVMRDFSITSISSACAIWYDRRVEQAAMIINGWINR